MIYAILALMIPIIGVSIPIVITVSNHKLKKAEIIAKHGGGSVRARELEERILLLEDKMNGMNDNIQKLEDKNQFMTRLLEEK